MALPSISWTAVIPRDMANVLAGLPRSYAQSAITPSLNKGLNVFTSTVKKILRSTRYSEGISPSTFQPRKKLYQGITHRTKRYRDGRVFGIVGFRANEIRKNYAHAYMVEGGTRPHTIVAGTFRGQKTGKRTLVKPPPLSRPRKLNRNNNLGAVVHHPGADPLHYFSGTFINRKNTFLSTFFSNLRTRTPIAIERYAKQKFRNAVVKALKSPGVKVSVKNIKVV